MRWGLTRASASRNAPMFFTPVEVDDKFMLGEEEGEMIVRGERG